jgi:hypothetical protein
VIVFPLIGAGVSAVFATMLFVRFARRKKLPQLFWGIALAMFAVASLVVAYGITQSWDATSYRMFWLFGVMLNVPWLALGSVALLRNRYITIVALVIVAGASVWGIARTFSSHACAHVQGPAGHVVCVDGTPAESNGSAVFGREDIPRGRDVWASPSGGPQAVYRLGILYSTIAYIVVIMIAVFTSRARKGIAPPPERRRGNLLIAIGVTVVAVGGTALSRFGHGAPFSMSLAVGAALMFAGFLYTSRSPRHVVTEPGESPT